MGFAGRNARSVMDNFFSGSRTKRRVADVEKQLNSPALPKITAPVPAGAIGGIMGVPPAITISEDNNRKNMINALLQR